LTTNNGPSDVLTIEALVDVVGRESFQAACAEAMSAASGPMNADAPHDLSSRLWWDGDEPLRDRLAVAVELYRRMPCYANLMYWRYSDFDEPTQGRMWGAYRGFLGDSRDAVSGPVEYSLWVDYFEDVTTVERAWREVAGPQEPRRPRLERVVRASGPVPWMLKAPLYELLQREGGWDEPLLVGLHGSCIDIYGSLERSPALHLFRRLQVSSDDERHRILELALTDQALPTLGADRRMYMAERLGKV